MEWMIYGATGYTGQLVAEVAVRRGGRPILAGRSAEKLAPLAQRLGLSYRAFALDNGDEIAHQLDGVDLVYHAAGPFVQTSAPMLKACLATQTHYVDITGEIPVFEQVFAHHQAAQEAGVLLMCGAGFDVIPTDCLAKMVAERLPSATHLAIAISSLTRISAGTGKSALGIIADGGLARREGRLESIPLGSGARPVPLPYGHTSYALPIPWGDLSTAYRTTGIPNITTYMVVPRALAQIARWGAPLAQRFFAWPFGHRLAEAVISRALHGPAEAVRDHGRAYAWAQARDDQGNQVQAWLETPEPYYFTALAGVLAIERLGKGQPVGALTPAVALGADFVLSVDGTRLSGDLAADDGHRLP